jgi:cystathionine gamma-synthase
MLPKNKRKKKNRKQKRREKRVADIETTLSHVGSLDEGDNDSGAIVAPLVLSTIYARRDDGRWKTSYSYQRQAAPNRELLETAMTQLERGFGSVSYASGMGAAHGIVFALGADTHVVVSKNVYSGVLSLLGQFERWRVSYSVADFDDLKALEAHMNEHCDTLALLWCETVSNPLLRVADVGALAALVAKFNEEHHVAIDSPAGSAASSSSSSSTSKRCVGGFGRICLVVDSTWTTPYLTRPLEHGADFVMHSGTKYIGGHSDCMFGVTVAKHRADVSKIRAAQYHGGNLVEPFTAYLAARGLRTLHVRMEAACRTAMRVAQFLEGHRNVAALNYPGLKSNRYHGVASRHFDKGLYGAMLSFEVRGRLQEAVDVVGRLRVFVKATSLGSTESLAEPSATIHPRMPVSLVRLSIGLEHHKDLIDDLKNALTYDYDGKE